MNLWCAILLVVAILSPATVLASSSSDDALLKVLELSSCPFQIEPIGCYKDVFGSRKRTLPDEVMNSRVSSSLVFKEPGIQWKNYHHWIANFICECARTLFAQKPEATSDYIGMQFYGQCWANLDKYLPSTYDRYGKSDNCIDSSYQEISTNEPNSCGLYMGRQLTNYVYKISRINRACPEMAGEYLSEEKGSVFNIEVNSTIIKGAYKTLEEQQQKVFKGELFNACKGEIALNGKTYQSLYEPVTCKLNLTNGLVLTKRICNKDIQCPHYISRGCWNDPLPGSLPSERPMGTYAMNERDPYATNWNGKFIDWKNWGKGYLADLLCRCAKIAKNTNKKFFSIQFYGECWTSNNEDFMKYGNVTRCIDSNFKACPSKDTTCRTKLCAGESKANKVYEITQGSFKCASNPCQHNGKCITNGPGKYTCICKSGYSGENCENDPKPVIEIGVN